MTFNGLQSHFVYCEVRKYEYFDAFIVYNHAASGQYLAQE